MKSIEKQEMVLAMKETRTQETEGNHSRQKFHSISISFYPPRPLLR